MLSGAEPGVTYTGWGQGCAIVVDATAALTAQRASLVQRLLAGLGAKARMAIIGVIDRARDDIIDVMADHVGEHQRPHAEPARPGERLIDGGGIDPFPEGCEPFRIIGPRNPVDDEAGDISHPHRDLAPLLHQREKGFCDHSIGALARHHLHQLHHRDGVEEMQPRKALRLGDVGADFVDGQRRGVAGEDGIRRDQLRQTDEQRGLDCAILDDRLHHQPRGRDLGHVGCPMHPREYAVSFEGVHLALADELFQRSGEANPAAVECTLAGVDEDNAMPRTRGDLRNAAAHCPRTHDGDARIPVQNHAALLAANFALANKCPTGQSINENEG